MDEISGAAAAPPWPELRPLSLRLVILSRSRSRSITSHKLFPTATLLVPASEAEHYAHTGLEIEVEARTLEDVAAALERGVERILLDNMSPERMAQAVQMNSGRAKLEASGNVTLDNVRRVAESGVDFISIGALTHSVMNFDISLLWVK